MFQEMFRTISFGINGYRNYTKNGFYKRFKTYKPLPILDSQGNDKSMENYVTIVTGANSGLGYQTAYELARRGAEVHLLCRNEEKGNNAINKMCEEINQENMRERLHLHIVDMSSIASIDRFVDQFTQNQQQRLNVMCLNAGSVSEKTEDGQLPKDENGNEYNFSVHVLGPYHMTQRLIPLLEQSAKEKGEPSRIVWVSSGGMYTHKLNTKHLQNDHLINSSYYGTYAYAHCKRQIVCLTKEFADRFDKSSITFNSCHPGWTDTPGVQQSLPGFRRRLENNLRTLEQGADTQIYLCVSDNVRSISGKFFEDREPVSEHLTLGGTQETKEDRETLYNYVNDVAQKVSNAYQNESEQQSKL